MAITFNQLANELHYSFDTLRRVYNRARTEEPEAEGLPSIGQNDIVPEDAAAFMRSRFGSKALDKQAAQHPYQLTPSVLSTELEKLQAKLAAKQSALDGLNVDFNKKHDQLLSVMADLASANEKVSAYEADLSKVKTDLTIANGASKSVSQVTETYKSDAERAKKEAALAQEKLVKAIETNGNQKAELMRLTQDCLAANKSLDMACATIESLEMDLGKAKVTINDYEHIADDQKQSIAQQNGQLNQFKSELFTALKLIKTHEATIEALTGQLQKVAWKFHIPTRLDLINYTEMGLASYGLWLMLDWSGLFLSIIANCFYFDAQKTLKNADAWKSADLALFITGLLSIGFGLVHFNTFMKSNTLIQYDKWWTAVSIAATVSGLSFAALWQSNNKTNEL